MVYQFDEGPEDGAEQTMKRSLPRGLAPEPALADNVAYHEAGIANGYFIVVLHREMDETVDQKNRPRCENVGNTHCLFRRRNDETLALAMTDRSIIHETLGLS